MSSSLAQPRGSYTYHAEQFLAIKMLTAFLTLAPQDSDTNDDLYVYTYKGFGENQSRDDFEADLPKSFYQVRSSSAFCSTLFTIIRWYDISQTDDSQKRQ